MVKIVFVLLQVWLLCSQCIADRQDPQDPLFARRIYRVIREFTLNIFGRSATEPRYLKQLENDNKVQEIMPKSKPFPCKFRDPDKDANSDLPLARSEKRPTSVHALRPGDIDVIAAMGDSLTAGNGAAASNLFHVLVENKGISWSIGGQGDWRRFLTLPNIIKEFNPKLIGYSLGDVLSYNKLSQFNVAELGAMSRDMPHMAKELVKRMYNDKRVNIKNDWKLVTLLMGANDFCSDFCYIDPTKAAATHKKELLKALKILKKNLPRTLVNLVIAPDVTLLKNFTGTSPTCNLMHKIECPCFFGEVHKSKYGQFKKAIREWQEVEEEIQRHPELNDSDDFAVVLQTFVKNVDFPKVDGKTDFSYMSADCFHFSQKGYARASNALWNNMMEPVGQKSVNWVEEFTRFLCPTHENPYIFTVKNSNIDNNKKSSTGSILTNLVKRGAKHQWNNTNEK